MSMSGTRGNSRNRTGTDRGDTGAARTRDLSIDESIAQLMRSLARDFTRALERRLAGHDITIGMWFPLRILWERDGIDQHELQKMLGRAQPTIASAMDKLEQRGLVVRRRSQNDGRRFSVHLTKRGRALKQEVLHFATEVQEIALEKVSPGEVELLLDIFTRIRRSLLKDSVS